MGEEDNQKDLPFAPVVFREDGNHSFHRAQDGSVNNHGSFLVIAIMATEKRKLFYLIRYVVLGMAESSEQRPEAHLT